MDRAEERAGPEDVGDQALMRGLDTALPFVRPGLSLSEIGLGGKNDTCVVFLTRLACSRRHAFVQMARGDGRMSNTTHVSFWPPLKNETCFVLAALIKT
jgi:hypothetical protein